MLYNRFGCPSIGVSLRAGSGAALWTPANASVQPAMDIDAANATISGSDVTAITDSTGNGYDWSQASASLQPTAERDFNGYAAIDFDGSQAMDIGGSPQPGSNNSMLFMVLEDDAAASGTTRYITLRNGTSTRFGFLYNSGSMFFVHNSEFSGPTFSYQTGKRILSGYKNGASAGGGYDGSNTSGVAGNTGVIDAWFAGAGAGNPGFDGGLVRVIWCDGYNADDYAKYQGYLAHRYGLTLASGHPYENSPPTV